MAAPNSNEAQLNVLSFSEQDAQDTQEDIRVEIQQLENQLNVENKFDATEVAFAELKLADDNHTNAFKKFMAAATNFASSEKGEKLKEIFTLVTSASDLFQEIMKESEKLRKFGPIVFELINWFVRIVRNLQHQIAMQLIHLKRAQRELSFIGLILNRTDLPNDQRKEELKRSIDNIFCLTQGLFDLTKKSSAESCNLHDKVQKFKVSVEHERAMTKLRKIIKQLYFPIIGAAAGGTTAGGAVGSIVGSTLCGGTGLLTIGVLSLNPFGAIIGASIFGITIGGLIALFIYILFLRETRIINYLTTIINILVKLTIANSNFKEKIDKFEVSLTLFEDVIKELNDCLISKLRRENDMGICDRLSEATKLVIENMEKINRFDISKWTDENLLELKVKAIEF